ALDIAVVGPALPSIRSQFASSERSLAWIFSIYVLFQLIGTPLMAKLSDQLGRRPIYVLDVTLFAVGSLIVALSQDFSLVLLGRATQGFGAGGIFPVASAVIGDTFPPEKRGGALGMIGAVFGLAFLVGPLLGGVIISLASWHWLFFINIPLALAVIVLSLRYLPLTRPAQSKRFDWLGMVLLAVMLASLAWAVNRLDVQALFTSLTSLQVWPFLVLFAVLLLALLRVERKVENPIVSPALFARKQLRLTYLLSAGIGFGEASLVFVPLLAVISLSGAGITEKNASFLMVPAVLALAVGAPTAGRFLDKVGSRSVILTGTLVMSLGMFMVGLFASNLFLFITSGVFIGLGMSALLGAPIRYIMLNEARLSERSVAQGVATLFTSIGQLLGGTLTGAIAASASQAGDAAAGYRLAFLIIGIMSALLVMVAFLLKNRAAEQATVRQNEASAGREFSDAVPQAALK
ncbi:MAG: MFS transporter, partial [Anaerolineaceae bacterium]|nr:MFS transporter [Anaerolineaceae bacterium]